MGERYTILGAIAKGGMAQVYLGRMVGSGGFSRLVAIKRLHESMSSDREFVAMLLDEARLTAQIRHTNVVDTLDLVVNDGAFALVLEWVEGAALNALLRRAASENAPVPRPIALAIIQGVLRGLAAAHDARAEDGQPLGIVHRDVSPQNVLVGIDGIPRIIDFGIAKARGKLEETRPGEIRGKYAYMAPEQLMGRPVSAQVDVYATGVMLWELLTGRRLFKADDERVIIANVMQGDIPNPHIVSPAVPPELGSVVLKATAREPGARFLDAKEMLAAIEPYGRASEEEVGAWVRTLAADVLASHQKLIQASATQAPARSLDALLAELASSPRASLAMIEGVDPLPSQPLPISASGSFPQAPSDPHFVRTGSVRALAAAPRESSGNTTLLLAVGAFALLALIGLVLGAVSLRKASAEQRAQVPTTEPAPLASTAAPPTMTAPAAEPVASVAASAAASASASPSASVSASAAAPARPPVKRRPAPRRDPTEDR